MRNTSTSSKILSYPNAHLSPGTPRIWAFGGGKGGIGKSFLCSNLAVCMAQLGHQVVIVDLDLGGANIHTCLGGQSPKNTLSDFLSGRIPHLESIVTESPISNLSFISGANDALNITEMSTMLKDKLIKAIRALPHGLIFLDLGAGTSEATMDFFITADQSIVVTTPEPTAIENAYRFIKTAFYRKLRQAEANLSIQSVIDEAMDQKNKHGIRTPSDLVRYIQTVNPADGKLLKNQLSDLKLRLVVNQTRSHHEADLGTAMRSVCLKYFGVDLDYAGCIDFDNSAWQSLRKKQPLVSALPFSNLTSALFKMARALAEPSTEHQPFRKVS